jgi:hypothetical protein
VKLGLRDGGDIIRLDAGKKFRRNVSGSGVGRTADGFRTYVRAGGIVSVEQSLGKTTGLRPDWGALQMTQGLLPAREEKLDEVAERIEDGVGGLLHKHGF